MPIFALASGFFSAESDIAEAVLVVKSPRSLGHVIHRIDPLRVKAARSAAVAALSEAPLWHNTLGHAIWTETRPHGEL